MPRWLPSILGGLAAAALAAFVYVWFWGSILVRDPHGQVAEAWAANSQQRQRLHRLPWGTWFAVPALEGGVYIRCKDGTRAEGAYVTGNWHTRVTVEPGCRPRGN